MPAAAWKYAKNNLRLVAQIGVALFVVFATLVASILYQDTWCATPARYGLPICHNVMTVDLGKPMRVQAMMISTVYRDATQVCKLADTFSHVELSAQRLSSEDIEESVRLGSIDYTRSVAYKANMMSSDAGSMARTMLKLCVRMSDGAERYVHDYLYILNPPTQLSFPGNAVG